MTFTDDEVATIRGALLRALEDQGGEYPDYDGGHGLGSRSGRERAWLPDRRAQLLDRQQGRAAGLTGTTTTEADQYR